MKKTIPYIVGIIIAVFAVMPPIYFSISAPNQAWPWLTMIFGFASFYLWFLKTPRVVKVISTFCFINCFYSTAPLISFTAFFSVVACCYFFVLCSLIEDHYPTFRILNCLIVFNVFIYFMQLIKHDPIFNFESSTSFGIIGQHMQSASFMVILSAALILNSSHSIGVPLIISIICRSTGGFLSGLVGATILLWRELFFKVALLIIIPLFYVWLVQSGKLEAFHSEAGRMTVWIKTLRLALQHPFIGYGIGTFKYLFPVLSEMKTIPWITTHNCWIQYIFETGFMGFSIFFGYFSYLILSFTRLLRRSIFKQQSILCLTALTMIATNMMVAFPTRMIQSVLIIIFVLAYCQKVISYASNENSHC